MMQTEKKITVAITGHTSGIGKAYVDACQRKNFKVKGFCRSLGYDITKIQDQERIIAESNDCDIFINNAHDGFSQTELFSRCWIKWKHSSKIMICTGSYVTLRRSYTSGTQHQLGCSHYAAEKAALEMAINWAWTEDTECHVVLIKPALTDTPRTQNMKKNLKTLNPIDPNALANFVLDSVLNTNFKIRELTIVPQKMQ
jgi:NADP-dependent 3-hydroxy acid dehydrogenase YdfG